MKLLGLPGRLQSTLAPMSELVRTVRFGATSSQVQSYGFWSVQASPNPDPAPEAAIAAASGAKGVIAKSFGTLVTMIAETQHGFEPDWCVFIGTPLKRFKATGLEKMLIAHCRRCRTLFIQQTSDFNGPYDELAAFVSTSGRAACVEVPGDDHVYSDIPLLARSVEGWRARSGG